MIQQAYEDIRYPEQYVSKRDFQRAQAGRPENLLRTMSNLQQGMVDKETARRETLIFENSGLENPANIRAAAQNERDVEKWRRVEQAARR